VISVASLLQGPFTFVFVAEHPRRVLLVTLKLCQENVHFAFLHLVDVAEVNKKFICLVKWQSHIAEVHYKFAKFIKNQV